MNALHRIYLEARGKVTTYVALCIAGVAQLAEHAEDLHSSMPSLAQYLPDTPLLTRICHYIVSALGLLVIYTRVRRLLGLRPVVPAPVPEASR
jgi:hypothetical protein